MCGLLAVTINSNDRLIMTTERGTFVKITTYDDPAESRAERFKFEHDTQTRLFVLTAPDGKTQHFRDNPARHLVVEPDPKTGEMRPVVKCGEPSFIYLCREDREV
jgi:hypothetical protein